MSSDWEENVRTLAVTILVLLTLSFGAVGSYLVWDGRDGAGVIMVMAAIITGLICSRHRAP